MSQEQDLILQVEDPVVAKVLTKMAARSRAGIEKYGQTIQKEIDSDIKNIADYVIDVQEELMDAILYLEAVKAALPKPILFEEEERYGDSMINMTHEYDINDGDGPAMFREPQNNCGCCTTETRSVYPGDAYVTTTTHNID